MLQHLIKFFAALVLLSHSAFAGPYDDMVTVKILDGWRNANGTHIAAIEFSLKPGWKTYWRAPGDAGIPPIIGWSGSQNLASAKITWPTPSVFDQNGVTSIGYKDRVVFPIVISPKNPSKPVRLKINMQIGVCYEVCVPAQFTLAHKLPANITKRDPKIVAALADRPFSSTEANVKGVSCAVSPTNDGLSLQAKIKLPPTGGDEFVVFETGDPQIWSSQAKVSRQGNILTATSELIHASGTAFALDRSAIRITVLGRTRSVDIRGCS